MLLKPRKTSEAYVKAYYLENISHKRTTKWFQTKIAPRCFQRGKEGVERERHENNI